MSNTHIINANLTGAKSGNADLEGSDLTNTDLSFAMLYRTSFSQVDLSGSELSNVEFYDDAIWTVAYYFTSNEPTWDSNMGAAWRNAAGIIAVNAGSNPPISIPEPSALILTVFVIMLVFWRCIFRTAQSGG